MSAPVQLAGAPQPPPLPPLRDDLQIVEGAAGPGGAPAWLIYDPLQHRYIHINAQTRELLALWRPGATAAELAATARESAGEMVAEADVARLVEFVRMNRLVVEERPGHWRELLGEAARGRHSLLARVLHNYLFFRVPLVRPQRFLDATAGLVAPLYTRTAAAIVVLAGLLGLYLVSRQWDTFVGTFHAFFTLEGAAGFAVGLFVVKALHELGHAYTARRFGCRVPSMGIAVMLMTPLLYTDVTDAWRLASRRKRLLIDSAGIVVELSIACLATLLWAFLPDGVMRGIAFVVATTGWLMSLGLNLNPFMRFDGYYILSDLIGVENLQPRAFALGRWRLRRLLFAPELPPPEPLPPKLSTTLILYAWAVWLYRLVVFTGIALMVYAYFFKLLGIVLFAVEIGYFIVRPIVGEIMEWRRMPTAVVSRRRALAAAASLVAALVVFVVPWSHTIAVPAILEASDTVQVFPRRAAQIVSVEAKRGQRVAKGDILVKLRSPDLDSEVRTTRARMEAVRLRLDRATVEKLDREDTLPLTNELHSYATKLAGLQHELIELDVRAPEAGTVLELDPALHAGRWIAKSEMVALIGDRSAHVVRGYADENGVARLAEGMHATFIPDDATQAAIPLVVMSIAPAGAAAIEIAPLASVHGGRISVETDSQQRLYPVSSQFIVELQPGPGVLPPEKLARGVAVIDGESRSLAVAAAQQVLKVLIRESGF